MPTILVGSNHVYLVNEENSAPKLTFLEKKYANYSSVQWLDSNDGQPGEKIQMLIGEDTTDCSLKGGEFLLINENIVLRIEDLAIFPFNKNGGYTDGYYPGNVLAFSPDKNEIVFLGSKSDPVDRLKYIYAMLVFNFKDNHAYAVPFDRTETRLQQPYQINSDWVYTYFEWEKSEADKYILAPKKFKKLPHWTGYFTQNGLDILKEIRLRSKTLPVVMLSSQERYTTAAQTIGHGAIHYVIKGQKAFDEVMKVVQANV